MFIEVIMYVRYIFLVKGSVFVFKVFFFVLELMFEEVCLIEELV